MFVSKHLASQKCSDLKNRKMLWCETSSICEDEYIDRFSSLHKCTFKIKSAIMQNNNEKLWKRWYCE